VVLLLLPLFLQSMTVSLITVVVAASAVAAWWQWQRQRQQLRRWTTIGDECSRQREHRRLHDGMR
jgi:hypothetical protein